MGEIEAPVPVMGAFTVIGLQNFLSDPAFQAGLAKPIAEDPDAAILRWTQIFGDTSITWDDLPFLRQHLHGPIVLKGILTAADAIRAAAAGMDGVVVSNHGGRQVDGAVAALDALPTPGTTSVSTCPARRSVRQRCPLRRGHG